MRILIVAPWFRTLAHLYGRSLIQGGHDVLVISTGRHFEPGYSFAPEQLMDLDGSPLAAARSLLKVKRAIRAFVPTVVLEEPFTHPLWLWLPPRGIRRLMMLHEPAPARGLNLLDSKRRAVRKLQQRSLSTVLCFSDAAARVARTHGHSDVRVIPLLSELPDERVPPMPTERRGFALVGRLSLDKGIDIAVDAWRGLEPGESAEHPLHLFISEGDGYGAADFESWRAAGVQVHVGRFKFDEVAPLLTQMRCMLVPYRTASQSGAQLLGLQLGLTPLVSDRGALPEFQPDSTPPVATLEPAEWTARMSKELQASDHQGRATQMRSHYLRHFGDPRRVLSSLETVLTEQPPGGHT